MGANHAAFAIVFLFAIYFMLCLINVKLRTIIQLLNERQRREG